MAGVSQITHSICLFVFFKSMSLLSLSLPSLISFFEFSLPTRVMYESDLFFLFALGSKVIWFTELVCEGFIKFITKIYHQFTMALPIILCYFVGFFFSTIVRALYPPGFGRGEKAKTFSWCAIN